jgi:hypothetical protein
MGTVRCADRQLVPRHQPHEEGSYQSYLARTQPEAEMKANDRDMKNEDS